MVSGKDEGKFMNANTGLLESALFIRNYYCKANATVLPDCPACCNCRELLNPGETEPGICTLIWYSPMKPGAKPA